VEGRGDAVLLEGCGGCAGGGTQKSGDPHLLLW
jgi:hypothetical protein